MPRFNFAGGIVCDFPEKIGFGQVRISQIPRLHLTRSRVAPFITIHFYSLTTGVLFSERSYLMDIIYNR